MFPLSTIGRFSIFTTAMLLILGFFGRKKLSIFQSQETRNYWYMAVERWQMRELSRTKIDAPIASRSVAWELVQPSEQWRKQRVVGVNPTEDKFSEQK